MNDKKARRTRFLKLTAYFAGIFLVVLIGLIYHNTILRGEAAIKFAASSEFGTPMQSIQTADQLYSNLENEIHVSRTTVKWCLGIDGWRSEELGITGVVMARLRFLGQLVCPKQLTPT